MGTLHPLIRFQVSADLSQKWLGRVPIKALDSAMGNNTHSWLPIEANLDKRLHLEHLRVLIALFSFRGKNTNTVWPSREAIAKRTGMHIVNISKATSALVEFGWLTKNGNGGCSKATRYTITVPEHLIEEFESETVAQQATGRVAQQATGRVAQQATGRVAQQATGIELTNELTTEQKRKPRASLADDGGEHFKTFWTAYPKKAGKDAAKKAFAKRKFDEQAFEKVMAALNEQKASEQWVKDAGQFIPHPATWLNQGRFDDELMGGGQQASSAFSGAI